MVSVKIIDTHCDVLYKLQMAKRYKNHLLHFRTSKQLDANMERLRKGGVYIQFFAIFIDPNVPKGEKWEWALEQIELFKHEIVAKNDEIKHIRKWSDINELSENEIGAVLALEGADPIGNDLEKLFYLYDQGVLSIGLTWNHANFCADGIEEEYNGGLTSFGKEVIQLNNQLKVLTDVSHLSEKSFWDVMERAEYVFASHSNSRFICNHPRNLSDVQINALFAKNGLVNITFYPPFIYSFHHEKITTTSHIIEHIKHISSMGGVNHIGFGSDFDGIDLYVDDLHNASYYQSFIDILLHHFSYDEVNGFASENFIKFLLRTGAM